MTLYIGLGLAHRLWVAIVVIVLEAAFGWAQYITASNAIVADLTPFERRAEAFSIQRVALNAGITLGPLVAVPLIGADAHFRLAFTIGGLICGLFLLLVLTRFRRRGHAPCRCSRYAPPSAATGRGSRPSHGGLLSDRPAAAVLLRPDLGDAADHAGRPARGERQHWGLLLVAFGAGTTILHYPLIRWLRHRDPMLLMAAASACLGVDWVGASWPGRRPSFPCSWSASGSSCSSHRLDGRLAACTRRASDGTWRPDASVNGRLALGPLLGGLALDALGGRIDFLSRRRRARRGSALPLLCRAEPRRRRVWRRSRARGGRNCAESGPEQAL